ncbi:MAG: 16S rRNA (guanine(966)-N(2))-methyltransferase RsmD [Clostridia bacterium]|nr:16S rRNA (guanine(966)-N(2))-methyltransferase RsmD [Clostridia bacterium]
MRIIAGRMKGTKLFTLDGLNTRPTLDRVKEPLFSIINFKLEDSVVLDLFSGSGALGLESISRGAKTAYLCDNSYNAIRIINQNVEKTKTQDQAVVVSKSFEKVLEECSLKNIKFDIIFLDPPYKTDYAEKATEIIIEKNLLNDNGIIIIETDAKEKVIENLQSIDITMYDERKYGRVSLLFLRKE